MNINGTSGKVSEELIGNGNTNYAGEITIELKKNPSGKICADPSLFPSTLDGTRAVVTLTCEGKEPLTYRIFAQAGMDYDGYNEYLNHHGCACSTLTSVLGAFSQRSNAPNAISDLTPDRTIHEIERSLFPEDIWEENYSHQVLKQSPINLFGISQVLTHFGISNIRVPSFRRKQAITTIREHLETGMPVIIETSRVRYVRGIPVTTNDRKFAGSYHVTALVAIEPDGDTAWMIDSAYRDWSGNAQRLKRVSLKEIINYMFSCTKKAGLPVYYEGRLAAGGFILVE
ncbi:MAG: hypothetical protein IJ070_00445 [Firmicutes bacterium]|nr:hypothetical protein [Bacillota bacterium]